MRKMKKTLDPAEARDRQIFTDVYRFFMKYRDTPPTEDIINAQADEMIDLVRRHEKHPLAVSLIVGASGELDRRWAEKIEAEAECVSA